MVHYDPRNPSTTGDVVVVGGGLAGLAAAIEASQIFGEESGRKVYLVDKQPNLGGNSAKASSGMSTLNGEAGDTVESFHHDTMISGKNLGSSELVGKLVAESPGALAFLSQPPVSLDLSVITQLGGHSYPRTHSNPTGPNVGSVIINALKTVLGNLSHVTILPNHTATDLTTSEAGAVTGVNLREQTQGTDKHLPAQAVIIATGGFGANRQMLEKHAPHAAQFPTTSGPQATGEGVGLGQSAGAAVVDLDKVQIHPTGFVNPKDEDAMTKFLAPEKLRGVGGILLSPEGRRFVNELATRDVVTDAVLSQSNPKVWLLLASESASMFGPTLKFYVAKGFATEVANMADAADHMKVDPPRLLQELAAYNDAAAAGKDDFGKTVFPTKLDLAGPFYLLRVTPVVHYCMGGLAINADSQVLDQDSKPIQGLYAAGEVTGGVHGGNRLAGNSLLDCVVFGRTAGRNAAQAQFTKVEL